MATCKDGCLSAKYDFGENNFFNNLKRSWLFYTFCALNLTGNCYLSRRTSKYISSCNVGHEQKWRTSILCFERQISFLQIRDGDVELS